MSGNKLHKVGIELPGNTTFHIVQFAGPEEATAIAVDSTINARKLLKKADGTPDVHLETATATVLVDLGEFLDRNRVGQLDEGLVPAAYLSLITSGSASPMPIRIAYFNDRLEWVLDFLATVSPNRPFLFNVFDAEIPDSGGENVRDRIFGPARSGQVMTPIPTVIFGSGRFLVAARPSDMRAEEAPDLDSFQRELYGGFGEIQEMLDSLNISTRLSSFVSGSDVQRALDRPFFFLSYAGDNFGTAWFIKTVMKKDYNIDIFLASNDMPVSPFFRTYWDFLLSKVHESAGVIVLVSRHSLRSESVRREMDAAFDEEGKRARNMIYPISLDEEIRNASEGWALKVWNEKHCWMLTEKSEGHFRAVMEALGNALVQLNSTSE